MDYHPFIHPMDAKAMAAMKKLPGFETVTNAFLKFYDEKVLHTYNMAARIRIGPRQLPDIHRMLLEVCEKLEMEEPELYLEVGRNDAVCLGDRRPCIILQSGLVSMLTKEEVKSVLANMCAHILCHHNRYETMAMMAYETGLSPFGPTALVKPILWAINSWLRCAGFTADRIDAWVMGSADIVVSKLMKLYGGHIYNHPEWRLDMTAFLEQVEEFESEHDMSKMTQTLEKWMQRDRPNSFGAIRCAELRKWFDAHGADVPPLQNGTPKDNLEW